MLAHESERHGELICWRELEELLIGGNGALPVDTPAEKCFVSEGRQLMKRENLIMLSYLHE